MKVVILAGGFGTRISEESHLKPKPMVEIGERPILWHIMKIYSSYGFNDFVICLGYKGFSIKEYFAHYFLHESDVTFDFRSENERVVHTHSAEPWRVTLVNTGLETMTGGVRIPRLTNTQMDAVASPHSGEMVYNTTFQTLFIHNGNEWMLMESVRLVVWMSAWGAYHDGDFNESSDNSLYMKRLQVDRYCWDNTGNRSSAYNVHALLSVGVPDDMKYFPKLYGYDGRAPVWWGTWWGESHSMAANNWRSFMNNELITSIGGGVISHNILVLFADALYIASIGNKFIPWTGTADNGEHSTFNCQGWTNNDHSQDGKLSKITSSTDAGTWMSGDLEPCDSSHHVLCVGYDPRPQEIIPPP
jgi:hypothetical protein